MTERRRYTATIEVEGHAISGVLTDPDGRTHRYHGWVELIGMLEPPDERTARVQDPVSEYPPEPTESDQ